MARALLTEDRDEEAELVLRKTLARDPGNAMAHDLLGICSPRSLAGSTMRGTCSSAQIAIRRRCWREATTDLCLPRVTN